MVHDLCHGRRDASCYASLTLMLWALGIIRVSLSPLCPYDGWNLGIGRAAESGAGRLWEVIAELSYRGVIVAEEPLHVTRHLAHIDFSGVGIPEYTLRTVVARDDDEALISLDVEDIEVLESLVDLLARCQSSS